MRIWQRRARIQVCASHRVSGGEYARSVSIPRAVADANSSSCCPSEELDPRTAIAGPRLHSGTTKSQHSASGSKRGDVHAAANGCSAGRSTGAKGTALILRFWRMRLRYVTSARSAPDGTPQLQVALPWALQVLQREAFRQLAIAVSIVERGSARGRRPNPAQKAHPIAPAFFVALPWAFQATARKLFD